MPRFRPRISILNALLLTTIVAMAIVIVQLWREVGPLRVELAARRGEMGQLFIADNQKAHGIGVDWDKDGTWRWRLYLPETPFRASRWRTRTYVGKHSPFVSDDIANWLAGPRARGSIGGARYGREFTLEITLSKDEMGWYLQKGKDGRKERIPKEYDVWLNDPKHRFPVSMVPHSEQRVFEHGEPIVLLCVQTASESSSDPAGGDTILIWIEEEN
jgi:hypothetical protein